MMTLWLNRILLAMLVMAICFMAVAAFWLLWPYDVVRFEREPLPLERTTLRAGDAIVYHAVFDKLMDVNGVASIQLIDHTVTFYPAESRAGPPGHYDMWGRSYVLPAYVPPGQGYYLQFAVEYRVNPVRTIIERYRTEAFAVVE